MSKPFPERDPRPGPDWLRKSGHMIRTEIDADLHQALVEFSHEHDVTMSDVVRAALKDVLLPYVQRRIAERQARMREYLEGVKNAAESGKPWTDEELLAQAEQLRKTVI